MVTPAGPALGLLRSRQGVFVVADHAVEDWPVRPRREDPRHRHAGHRALVAAVAAGDAESAARAAQEELEGAPARLRTA